MLTDLILISIWACPSKEAVGSGCPFQSFWKGTQKGFSLASLTRAQSNPTSYHTNQQTQQLCHAVEILIHEQS